MLHTSWCIASSLLSSIGFWQSKHNWNEKIESDYNLEDQNNVDTFDLLHSVIGSICREENDGVDE